MYHGVYMLGQTVHLMDQVHNAAGTPAEPTLPVLAKVWSSGGTLILAKEMPKRERYIQTGKFFYDLFLDATFSAGQYSVTYHYTTGTYTGIDADNFEIVAGGHVDGAVLGMYYYERPQAAFVVHSTESGKVLPGKNPSL